jgi:hypothetical protein
LCDCDCSGCSESSPGSPCESAGGAGALTSSRDAKALESDLLQVLT